MPTHSVLTSEELQTTPIQIPPARWSLPSEKGFEETKGYIQIDRGQASDYSHSLLYVIQSHPEPYLDATQPNPIFNDIYICMQLQLEERSCWGLIFKYF